MYVDTMNDNYMEVEIGDSRDDLEWKLLKIHHKLKRECFANVLENIILWKIMMERKKQNKLFLIKVECFIKSNEDSFILFHKVSENNKKA